MQKLFFILCCALFIACNNEDTSATVDQNESSRTATSVTTNLSKESEMEILAECVDNAKDNAGNDLDDAKAYALCRCVLLQMQEKYPGADSSALVNYLRDTTQVVQMAEKCQ